MYKLNNIRRFLAVAAVLASFLVIATIAYRMLHGGASKSRVRKLPMQVDVSLQKVHYTEVKQGVKRWDLTADRAEFNKQNDITSLMGVHFVVSGGGGVGELQVTADRADYNNATRDVTLIGNVRGHSSKGMSFATTRANFVAARSELETSEPVRFLDAGLELEGVGMVYNTQTRRFRLLKNVNAVYRPQRSR